MCPCTRLYDCNISLVICQCCFAPLRYVTTDLYPTLYSSIFYLVYSLSYSYPLVTIHHYSHQTKRLLTPKELLAYTTPSLSALSYSLVSSPPSIPLLHQLNYLPDPVLSTSNFTTTSIFSYLPSSFSHLPIYFQVYRVPFTSLSACRSIFRFLVQSIDN